MSSSIQSAGQEDSLLERDHNSTDLERALAQLNPRSSDRRVLAALGKNMTGEGLRRAADSGAVLPGRDAERSRVLFNDAIILRIMESDDASNPYLRRGTVLTTFMYISPICLALAIGAVVYINLS